MYTVGMAYCGSGNNKAIRRLLHVAVSVCSQHSISLSRRQVYHAGSEADTKEKEGCVIVAGIIIHPTLCLLNTIDAIFY